MQSKAPLNTQYNRQSEGQGQRSRKPNGFLQIAAIVLACFVGFVLLIAFVLNSAYDDMRPHDQKLVKALKDDLLTGHWKLKKTRETAAQNAQESKEKLKQSTKREAEADWAYEQALAEQKRAVAAAKRKANKAV